MEYSKLEREIIDHFKSQYLGSIDEDAVERVYRLAVDQSYGIKARDPHIAVDWKAVFSENKCPTCPGRMKLEKDSYICSECALSIPATIYDKALSQHMNMERILETENQIKEKIAGSQISGHQLESLYDIARDEADEEYERQKELERQKRTNVINPEIRRWRDIDER